jgi:hypothetical protein
MSAQGDLRAAGMRLESARRAAAAGNVEAYYAEARAASRLVPPHAVLYYHLARAAAMSGRTEEALSTLARLAHIGGVARDPAADTGFGALRSTPRFQQVLQDIAAATATLMGSDTAFVIDAPNLVVENLAFDPRGHFHVGSMARREIIRSDVRGRSTPFVGADQDIGQPLGMKVDTAPATLWVASIWPPDSAKGRPRQTTALLNIDAQTGRVRQRLVPPDTGRPHLLNDIVIAPEGALFISDSDGAAVWRLRKGAERLELWLELPRTVLYPNGIALSPDARFLFVAHQTGILGIERATRRVFELIAPESATLMGIDGLYATRTGLVGVQNSLPVHQIIAIDLAYSQTSDPSVRCARVLERRHPSYVIPTTGTMVGDTLYYVANSELRRLDPRGTLLEPNATRQTVILRLPIQPACRQ